MTSASPIRALLLATLAATALLAPAPLSAASSAPLKPIRPATHAEVGQRIQAAAAKQPKLITVNAIGKSWLGRDLWSVHLRHPEAPAAPKPYTILFYAQQHGDEVAGKDALLALIDEIADDPKRLPADVDLYAIPMMNPDGGTSDTRRNAHGADLNRDHQLLEQPEVRALHGLARLVMPDVAVDCHEYTRDSPEYRRRGIYKWPLIMMDACNVPSTPDRLKAQALRHIDAAAPALAAAGINYARYELGGPPPDFETRHSTLEVDDGRNSLSALGILSFIIESGILREKADSQDDLAIRVQAYLLLFHHFLDDATLRADDRAAVEAARREPPPPFLATNAFWGSVGLKATGVRTVEAATGKTRVIPSAMHMEDVIVKRAVSTPIAYAIVPTLPTTSTLDIESTATVANHFDTGDIPLSTVLNQDALARFKSLLDRHHLTYEVLDKPTTLKAESTRLLRVERTEDPLYARFENRTIAEQDKPKPHQFPAGAILVHVAGPKALPNPDALRACILLEPNLLYSLYQYPQYRAYVSPADGILPVWRVLE